jgi:hypothetical protein
LAAEDGVFGESDGLIDGFLVRGLALGLQGFESFSSARRIDFTCGSILAAMIRRIRRNTEPRAFLLQAYTLCYAFTFASFHPGSV